MSDSPLLPARQVPVIQDALTDLLKQLVVVSFPAFLVLELGLEVARPHLEWWEDLKTGEDVIELSPRDHGKSHALIRGYAIWRAKYHSRYYREILILGADTKSAIENMDKLKSMLTTNHAVKALLPTDRESLNSRAEVILSNGVAVKAKGWMSPLRGRHPQLILLDDVLNEKNSLSEDARARTDKYFFEVVYPMKDKGSVEMRKSGFRSQIVLSGTAQHKEDLYHKLLASKLFRGRRQSAITDVQAKEVLWKERYSYEDLMKIKAAQGALSFSKEYQNEPLTEEMSLFPPSLFEQMKDHNRSYLISYEGSNGVYLGVDFSVPGDASGDFTVAMIGELLPNGTIVLLHVWRNRPQTVQEQLRRVGQLTQDFKVSYGLLEDNMFQRLYPQHFANQTNLPLRGHTVTRSGKNSLDQGVLSFRPIFENKKFVFPYRTDYDKEVTDQIIREFAGFNMRDGQLGNFSYHDDSVMAMWHMLVASRKTAFSYEF